MRRLLFLPALTALLVAAWPSGAEEQDLYASAVHIVQDRYLWPEALEAHAMLRGAVERLEEEVEWLIAQPDGTGFVLQDGDGRRMGRVEARRLSDLAGALRALEGCVSGAPWPLDEDVTLEVEILKGAFSVLDRHSSVLTGRRLERFNERIRGTLEGIGARIGLEDGVLVVRHVFGGGPADEGGLRDGDLLTRIDGVSTLGMDTADATERIRGPKGSTLVLEIERAGRTRTVRLIRREVAIPNLEDRVLPKGAALVRISHFSEQTAESLGAVLARLARAHALDRGLVLDLRGNSGGSMLQAAYTADQFLRTGRVLRTVGRDGAAVSNLVREVNARDQGTEPDVPLVVLTDRQSASASEILAGSLALLDRAVILGERTFGKSTIQKIYTLNPDVRLKLTVAEYLLAQDRSVADEGLLPDVSAGRIVFDRNGVRWDGGEGDLLFVDVRSGWSGEEAGPAAVDPLVDFAERVLAQSRGSRREDVLAAARSVGATVQAEQDALLVRTFARKTLDWSPAPAPGPLPEVAVSLTTASPPRAGDPVVLEARVENRGPTTLHRVRVVLRSENPLWNDLVLPVGRLAPGRWAEGRRSLRIPASLPARTDPVALVLEADGRPVLTADAASLSIEARPRPSLSIRARVLPESAVHRVELTVVNRGVEALEGVRLFFEFPEDGGLELVDREAIVEDLPAGAQVRVVLDVRALESFSGDVLPLVLRVDADAFGRLLQWDFPVALDGSVSTHEAPVVWVTVPAQAVAGEAVDVDLVASDDEELAHLCLYVNGRKVAYVPGERRAVQTRISFVPEAGGNALVARAEDQEGHATTASAWVHGLGDLPAVASPLEEEGGEGP
ncbi:MAG: PDZ domain-containing protein [Deltaproteobacteria bacterium]|nr:PDZ domain-containing protein [Deltaproteobacteria bacterium]